MRFWLPVMAIAVMAMAACDPDPNELPDSASSANDRRGPMPTATASASVSPPSMRGHVLETMTWLEAKEVLRPETVVVLPLGAASKEHGPHLQLNNDLLIANYYRDRVLRASDVVMAPTVGYHHYPAFVEYAGSVTLRLETARDLVVDICTSLAAYGPKRFYVLNTGVSTTKALAPAKEQLAALGIAMAYTDLLATRELIQSVSKQAGGTHADEIETSMMLVIAPETVDMSRAVDDYDDSGRPGLSPDPDAGKTYSPSGVWGNATLATREKGEVIVEARVKQMLSDIETLRAAAVPRATSGPVE